MCIYLSLKITHLLMTELRIYWWTRWKAMSSSWMKPPYTNHWQMKPPSSHHLCTNSPLHLALSDQPKPEVFIAERANQYPPLRICIWMHLPSPQPQLWRITMHTVKYITKKTSFHPQNIWYNKKAIGNTIVIYVRSVCQFATPPHQAFMVGSWSKYWNSSQPTGVLNDSSGWVPLMTWASLYMHTVCFGSLSQW